MTKQRSFDGTLLEVPFGSETVQSVAVEQYRDILTDHDREDEYVLAVVVCEDVAVLLDSDRLNGF